MSLENSKQRNIVIIGFGNTLMGDEGVGVYVALELQKRKIQVPDSCNLEIIDGGTAAFDVFLLFRNINRLIIVDAMKGSEEAGSLYRFTYADVKKLINPNKDSISLHDLNIIEALAMYEKLDDFPEDIVFIGIEPAEIKLKMELSDVIKDKIPDIARMVIKEVNRVSITTEAD
jgi:hydrogenase maturation protease